MYRRILFSSLAALLCAACPGFNPEKGTVFFNYSLWRDNGNGLTDIGCVDANIDRIRIDFLFQEAQVGGAESLCDAFGNSDSLTVVEELGEFLAEHESITFDQILISALRPDGTVMPFGLRLNNGNQSPAQQQPINFVEPITLGPGQQLNISLPGKTGSQIQEELQMIIP